jgi:hypothetical protein
MLGTPQPSSASCYTLLKPPLFTHLRGSTILGSPRSPYLTFPGFLIIPIGRALPLV